MNRLFVVRPWMLIGVALLIHAHAARAQTATPSEVSPTPPPPEAIPTRPVQPIRDGQADSAQRVEITGGRNADMEERRQSTAAKIVIGREEIDKFGDATVGEVLKRLPGVTTPGAPGRGGAPRLRGLGSGYTQLLIDGQRIPPGFSLESLSPDQIERIEILRAPTAETGARAIAGTINIVTREGFTKRINDLRLAWGYENGRYAPSVSWTRNDTIDTFIYNVSASASHTPRRSTAHTDTLATDLATGAVVQDATGTSRTEESRNSLHLTSRLQWRLGGPGDILTLMPTVFHSEGRSHRTFDLVQRVQDTRTDSTDDYTHGFIDSESRSSSGRLNFQWRQRLGSARLEAQGGLGLLNSHNQSHREEFRQPSLNALRQVDDLTDVHDRSGNLTLKWSTLLGQAPAGGSEHSWVTGLEAEALRREESRHTLQNGLPVLTDFGDNLKASSTRFAAYAQDEWSPDRHWAFHAGLRWEGIATQGEAAQGVTPENRSSVWTPLVHLLWRPDGGVVNPIHPGLPMSGLGKRDQVRLSLTRSYRSPPLGFLIARPSLNQRDPAPGPNTPTSPDSAGNPLLLPELARGIDLAFERYLEGGGILSANVFARRVQHLMRRVIGLETVSWASVPRWVARQQNIGDARTYGLELEAKFRLDQAWPGALPLEIRSNLSFYGSQVDNVPGPDNRLDSQPHATGNLGFDYRLRSLPWTVGGNFNGVPGYRTRLSEEQAVTVSTKRVVDAYALWTITPSAALRLMASNLTARDYHSTNTLDALGIRNASATTSPTFVNWRARLEIKL